MFAIIFAMIMLAIGEDRNREIGSRPSQNGKRSIKRGQAFQGHIIDRGVAPRVHGIGYVHERRSWSSHPMLNRDKQDEEAFQMKHIRG